MNDVKMGLNYLSKIVGILKKLEFMVLVGGCFLVLSDNIDFLTSISAIIAALMNIGPGFGDVGPSENYAFFSDTGKWFLSWNMLVGRLEMFTALVIFFPAFWKK